jgi:hypothetical protein
MMARENRRLSRMVETATPRDPARKEHAMKHLIALSAIAAGLSMTAPPSLAQSAPPPLPALTPQQQQEVDARMASYRRATDERVARGEIGADDAARLLHWREWQLARQTAARGAAQPDARAARPPVYAAPRPRDYGDAPRPRDDYDAPRPRDDYGPSDDYAIVEPAPAYVYRYPAPYYPAPYYWGPRPYAYWGPSVCAGGFGRHFGGRICF